MFLGAAAVLLTIDAFPQLPPPVAAELKSRGCRIPQATGLNRKHNVVQGEFMAPGQKDWAVLCDVKGITRLLVFWKGEGTMPTEVNSVETNEVRVIGVATPQFIRDHYRAYGGPKPPPLDHQGIEDGVVEKGSSVLYFYRGKWLLLTGSD